MLTQCRTFCLVLSRENVEGVYSIHTTYSRGRRSFRHIHTSAPQRTFFPAVYYQNGHLPSDIVEWMGQHQHFNPKTLCTILHWYNTRVSELITHPVNAISGRYYHSGLCRAIAMRSVLLSNHPNSAACSILMAPSERFIYSTVGPNYRWRELHTNQKENFGSLFFSLPAGRLDSVL